MKSKMVAVVTLIIGLVFIALPALAVTIVPTFSADCESYTINVSGVAWMSFEASYSLTLTPTSGDAISVEGTFPVPYDPSTIPNSYNTTFTGNWGMTLCGTYTVSGSVTLTSNNYEPVIGIFEPISLECDCEPCGECKGRVTQLILQYNGTSTAYVEVKQKKPKDTVFEGELQPGETFTFSGTDKKGTLGTEIRIYVDGVPNTKIHTSCSQPIGPGLISGDFEVIGGYSKYGGPLCPVDIPPEPPQPSDCECKGKVTQLTLQYNGTSAAQVKVEQKKAKNPVFEGEVQPGETFTFSGTDKNGTLGTEIRIFVDGVPNTKIHTSCSQPIGPGLISGDFEVIGGYSKYGGPLCPVDIPPEPPQPSDCECKGKVTQLTLQYNGTSAAQVKVEQKKAKNPVFEGEVQPGETFTFSGTDKNGTLGTEIRIFVDGVPNTKIHTSCSQPIGPGLISGDFEVIEGFSGSGGPLCPVNAKPVCNTCKRAPKPAITKPEGFALMQNHPNPFNPATTINFTLPQSSYVTVNIYNSLGKKTASLVNGNLSAGLHSVEWNARGFASGIYFYRITAGSYAETKRMLLMK